MAHQVKALAAMPNDLRSVFGTHMVDKTDSYKLPFTYALWLHTSTYMHTYVQKRSSVIKIK